MNLIHKAKFDNRILLAMGMLQLLGGLSISCKGSNTAVDFTVKVGADTCQEDKNAPVTDNEYVTLNCANVSGQGTVHVNFPRRAWWNIQVRDLGGAPSVPGK